MGPTWSLLRGTRCHSENAGVKWQADISVKAKWRPVDENVDRPVARRTIKVFWDEVILAVRVCLASREAIGNAGCRRSAVAP